MVPRVQTQSPRLPGQGRTAVLKPRPTHGWPVRAKDVHDVILKAQPWTDTQASVLPTIQPTQAAGYFLLVRLGVLNHADKGHLPRKGKQEGPGFTVNTNDCFGSLPYYPPD
uniref:uncharacterized protein LOC106999277 n=1 Tax=Macaca mulatta TaxID=9544 RepID=UPI0010A24350|nr:uncharacterized protein LOC106999277 [Macaca mulatta]